MKTVGYIRYDEREAPFGEFTIPCAGAVPEHGWMPFVLRADAEAAIAKARDDALEKAARVTYFSANKYEAESRIRALKGKP